MKVILRQDIPDMGKAGQTIEVKTGYGRNFLLPRNLAISATKANLKAIGEIEKQSQIRERKKRREAERTNCTGGRPCYCLAICPLPPSLAA